MSNPALWTVLLLIGGLMFGCPLNARGQITVASKAFPESDLLAETMAQLIEAKTSLTVKRTLGLGGTMVCFNALQAGEIDLYPEYTGTGLLNILNGQLGADRSPDTIYEDVRARFAEQFQLQWLGRFGFNNGYVLAAAPKLGLTKISDLRDVQDDIRVRFQHEFLDRADGYPGLQQRYGLRFGDVQGMEHGLAYLAMADGRIDVMEAYATDGVLATLDVTLLQDDKGLFPPYDAAPLVRIKTLQQYPQLRSTLAMLDGRITQDKMRAMNLAVQQGKRSKAEIASQFLIDEGLIEARDAVQDGWQTVARQYLRMLGEHLYLTLVATGMATVCGISLGLLVARHAQRLAGPVLGAVGILQTIPSLAMLAFMIPLLGIGKTPAIAALFLYGLLPIVRNTYTGITSVPEDLREAGLGMGMTPWQLLWQLELPLATRTIMAGIRTALVISVGTATLGAFIGAGGFGGPINTGMQQLDSMLILSGAVPAALLALFCDFVMACLERWLSPRGC